MGWRFLGAVVLVLMFPLMNSAKAEAEAIKLLVLGDSLTEGLGVEPEQAFPALLEAELRKSGFPEITVVNGGVSGSTSAGGLARLEWLLKGNPTHILIALGANDGLRGLKVEETEKNLVAIIEKCQTRKIPGVLAGMKLPPNYGKSYIESFEKVFPALATKYNWPLIPFLLEGVAGDPKLNNADGIHPNAVGHQRILQHIRGPIVSFLLAKKA